MLYFVSKLSGTYAYHYTSGQYYGPGQLESLPSLFPRLVEEWCRVEEWCGVAGCCSIDSKNELPLINVQAALKPGS
jgi:hypothetical protein